MIKKRLALMLLCTLLLTGCARQPVTIPNGLNAGLRAEPALLSELPAGGFPIQIGGVTLTPPLSLGALERLGFTTALPAEYLLDGGDFSDDLLFENGNASFEGALYNPSEDTLPMSECVMVQISATDFTASDGVKPGAAAADVTAAYGDAEDEMMMGQSRWLFYGTMLNDGLGFEIDLETKQLISVLSYCIPSGSLEAIQ